jgi:hypothetical protein
MSNEGQRDRQVCSPFLRGASSVSAMFYFDRLAVVFWANCWPLSRKQTPKSYVFPGPTYSAPLSPGRVARSGSRSDRTSRHVLSGSAQTIFGGTLESIAAMFKEFFTTTSNVRMAVLAPMPRARERSINIAAASRLTPDESSCDLGRVADSVQKRALWEIAPLYAEGQRPKRNGSASHNCLRIYEDARVAQLDSASAF